MTATGQALSYLDQQMPGETGEKARSRLVAILMRREVQLLVALLLMSGIVDVLRPQFLSSSNISFMLAGSVVIMVVATGQTMVIITRGIDLSVAPMLGIAAIAIGFPAQNHNLNIFVALVLVILIGIALGVGNGLLVTVAGIPPIIATLATLSVYGGLQFVFTSGLTVISLPHDYIAVGLEDIVPGIPWLLLIGVGIVIVAELFLKFTPWGRAIYAVGNNADAAYRAGIPVRRTLFMTYIICGLLSGIGGFVYLCYIGSASSTTGTDTNVNLISIAATLIGGTSLLGGRGRPIGAALGAVFLSVADTAIVVLRILPIWEPAGVGVLILLAVVTDRQSGPATRRALRTRHHAEVAA
ncbi:MAG: ABC transporter permease [Acidimicrobiales bacterium]|jgi:ribose/xylose/arabinose/galactoside ABC-type transport system permease subunit